MATSLLTLLRAVLGRGKLLNQSPHLASGAFWWPQEKLHLPQIPHKALPPHLPQLQPQPHLPVAPLHPDIVTASRWWSPTGRSPGPLTGAALSTWDFLHSIFFPQLLHWVQTSFFFFTLHCINEDHSSFALQALLTPSDDA